MNTKFRQLKYRFKHDFPLVNVLFAAAVAVFCACVWGTISSVTRNWELEQRLSSRQKELEIIGLEVESLELENQYYASEEYQELSARAKQNKMLEGETLIYLPKNSEAAKTRHETAPETSSEPAEDPRTNFELWLSFLLGL